MADEKTAKIIDWKTYPVPQNKSRLEKDWQTRLYLYVLAETSEYAAKQISMTYWFVKANFDKPDTPAFVKFAYNQAKHKKTDEDLTVLLKNLTCWLKCYQEMGVDFPQINLGSKACDFCQFGVRCERNIDKLEEEKPVGMLFDLANIKEVKL